MTSIGTGNIYSIVAYLLSFKSSSCKPILMTGPSYVSLYVSMAVLVELGSHFYAKITKVSDPPGIIGV